MERVINSHATLLSMCGIAICSLFLAACGHSNGEAPNGVFAARPTNTIKSALDTTVAALNRRDSAAYWNSLLFECREWQQPHAAAQALWDSAADSRVSYDLLYTREFDHTVHSLQDVALFGHALINLHFQGRKNLRLDSVLTILRVDTGRWMLGSIVRERPGGDLEDARY